MPAALLTHILLAQAVRQKQAGIGHRGRSAKKYASLQTAASPTH